MKRNRAREIAKTLNSPERWHSHRRAIDMNTLRGEDINLKIDGLEDDPELHKQVRNYFELLKDYMSREKLFSFIHTKGYF